ncbi:proline-rich protein 15-like protein [Callorhinchus milii]|uniref:Proline rich 15 like n=1 Tax=Callorhinchus milii TaxID=7868 RepID=K4FTB4_CALMI|nr:proline-rich protein 15-like protein [Callorhinchus milii]XP_007902580.1 proline-rich protein 15-like protein isoform X1 [Callorhinchus milii]XP_042199207.1 proline-rich protein 15-like protein [Callorhinchus milii]AFK11005.1 proline-rich protein 15-like protein-like protein [Callorhinchus milii]|eukprot:gi/632972280/ref/XP_007902579.1/ PREDICTED: proline-rich protein 15-like protein [Callorhinchus milii]
MGESATQSQSWWKLTFMRKKKSNPKVLYQIPVDNGNGESESAYANIAENELAAKLEKFVDKSTKGKHVRVSNSGRFREKKKVRCNLSDNPNFFKDSENGRQDT